ncbi:hypothetical protein KAFR_0A03700 [Kazachstania africana CBS 2517]|uniref:MADS-box domain-containing protein n=1 Tax=Kazachstania africana (strain ATCC 22294 / BCRC 22015 / CBS 2517 / CECT 1963 / NBRC 1671 / NRRL Y-8276) TaxID=1071382 RepID=H2AN55_KAZAF|nr:hypothetical protein KAFR_0A03700 [Kazachstania africana CBS 2517]CCF55805.1 hypothetical protein KAFR_0A03700 [Kazachstania africana CBS 2517]
MSDQDIKESQTSHIEEDPSLSPSTNNGKERRKIEIKFIENKTRRHVTFSKRKHGIMKKAFELSVLTGTQVLLLVVSETGLVYTFSTPKFEPIVTQQEGRNLIQACLNAPDEEEEEEDDQQVQQQQQQVQQQVQNDAVAQAQAQAQAHAHAQQVQQMQQQVQQHQLQQHPFTIDGFANPKVNTQQLPQQQDTKPTANNAAYQQYFQESQQNQF